MGLSKHLLAGNFGGNSNAHSHKRLNPLKQTPKCESSSWHYFQEQDPADQRAQFYATLPAQRGIIGLLKNLFRQEIPRDGARWRIGRGTHKRELTASGMQPEPVTGYYTTGTWPMLFFGSIQNDSFTNRPKISRGRMVVRSIGSTFGRTVCRPGMPTLASNSSAL